MSALLDAFRADCADWYRYHTRHNERARQMVYLDLMARYGKDTVLRWQHHIKAVLDRVEKETKGEK